MPFIRRLLSLLVPAVGIYLGYLFIDFRTYDFEVATCARLHNKILKHIIRSQNITYTKKKFFDVYDEENPNSQHDGDSFRKYLSPSTISFLERVNVIHTSTAFPFTPHLNLPDPSLFWVHITEGDDTPYNPYPYAILLYPSSGSLSSGLWFDMYSHKAAYFDHIEDGWPKTAEWYPLELALTRYWKMHGAGRFRVHPESPVPTISTKSYVQADVGIATAHYRALVESILFRMPGGTNVKGAWTTRSLVSKEKLDEWNVRGFAAEFLVLAKAPNFKYIAPGITFLDDNLFDELMKKRYGDPDRKAVMLSLMRGEGEEQAYSHAQAPLDDVNYDPHEGFEHEPLLIFPATHKLSSETLKELSPHPTPDLFSNYAGVYIRPTLDLADGIDFITPYPLGKNLYIRRGNAPLLSPNPPSPDPPAPESGSESTETSQFAYNVSENHIFESISSPSPYFAFSGVSALYQHGPCPLLPHSHATRLGSLLQLWSGNIRRGEFVVGEEGVTGINAGVEGTEHAAIEAYKWADVKGTGGVDWDVNICWSEGVEPPV